MTRRFCLIALSSFIFAVSAFAADFERSAIVMDWVASDSSKPDDQELKPIERTLTDLTRANVLESAHFKVVHGISSEAIRMDSSELSEKTMLRARTVYYHLTKAWHYYNLHKEFQATLYRKNIDQKVVVRVDMDHVFSRASHWQVRKLDPDAKDFSTYFSGSLTIPASDGTQSALDEEGNVESKKFQK
jgi:hypothetical protein